MTRRQKRVSSSVPRLFYTPCDSHQAGALVYINRFYAKLDPDRFPRWRKWLRIRDGWITEQESIHGKNNLTCAICGRTGLKGFIEISPGKLATKTRSKEQATIDHIKPVSAFPELWNNPSNFQIACYQCNQKKGCSH